MPISWNLFCDYILDIVSSVPAWVYNIALGIFVGGSVLLIRGGKKGKKLIVLLFLLAYYLLLLCSTVIFRETKPTLQYGLHPFWHYEAFRQGRLLLLPELVMNVLAFIPIGFAFCLIFRRIRWWQVAMCGMGLSIGIEFLQWVFKRGCADIDDVIHNTLGCIIGCCLYVVVSRFFAKEKNNM